MQADEIQQIMDLFKDFRQKGRSLMESYELIGQFLGRDKKVIAGIIQRMRPTTDLARMYFRARSYKMAKRLVAKASPAELIDILQRPSVGVLDPVKKIEGGGGGFFLNVNAESCGAVKIGVMQPGEQPKQLEAGTTDEDPVNFDPFSEVIDVGQGAAYVENGDAKYREVREEATHHETAIERVRRQLRERRESVGA